MKTVTLRETKTQGTIICGKTIDPSTFSILKRNNQVTYFGREQEEDFDMWGAELGWFVNNEGIESLRNAGYTINTITNEMQDAETKRISDERKAEKEKQESERKAKIAAEHKETEDFLKLAGNPEFIVASPQDMEKAQRPFRRVKAIGDDQYSVSADGYLHLFTKINFDWFENYISKDKVSPKILSAAIEQENEQAKKLEELRAARAADRISFVNEVAPMILEAFDRIGGMNEAKKRIGKSKFIPKELQGTEKAKSIKYQLTFSQALQIINEYAQYPGNSIILK